ncbi:MAG: type II secretion system minor pseudopilin GspK [Gammaproteobacteria bacterium]|nr:type II secretion system minor pseudopilin GspK [Gammaproteobacteria bacterium]
MKPGRHQRGIALLTALILVAFATLVAASIGFSAALTARRTTALFTVEQGLQLGAGAEAMAAYLLKQDARNTRLDSLDEDWAQPYGPIELDAGALLEASIDDQQGRFNLNSLVTTAGAPDPQARAQFERLLQLLGIDTRYASLLTDWIDPDQDPTLPDGAEDGLYLGLPTPYRAPNMPLSNITELLALPGMTRELFGRLAPYVTALPSGQPINLCTAPGVVLDALTPGQQQFSIDEQLLTERRQTGCFPTLGEFQAQLTPAQFAAVQNHVGENSQYFRLRSWISIGTTRFTLYSLLYRDQGGQIRPILRTFGTD